MMRRAWAGVALAGLCVTAACSSSPAATPTADQADGGHPASMPATSPARSGSVTTPGPARPAATPTASASAASVPAPQVAVSEVRTADGSIVTVATFRGPVQYVLHNGSQDPGPAAAGRCAPARP